MLSIMKTMSLEGVNGYLVEIQIDVSGGLPSFDIVGLPDMRVKEARERVRAAIKNAGINFPNRKIVVNLAPADRRKEGTFFDLPMAIGILNAIGEISTTRVKNFESTIFLGELSLDGKIKGAALDVLEFEDTISNKRPGSDLNLKNLRNGIF